MKKSNAIQLLMILSSLLIFIPVYLYVGLAASIVMGLFLYLYMYSIVSSFSIFRG